MGTILASAIITSARVTLLDPAPGATWSDPELLGFINEAERVICVMRPELFTKRGPITLVAGTLQSLPADGTALLKLDENVVSKRKVRLVVESLIDAANRFWPNATPGVDVQEYAVDARDRKRFQVVPPNTGTGSVRGLYGAVPPALVAVGNPINLDDVYEMPIKHLVIAQAYSANTKRQDTAKEAYHRGLAEKLLGINAQSLAALLPKLATDGSA